VATPDPRSIRIGTAEREQAVKALGEHFAQGRLEPAEFEERMTAAYAARTASELDRLFDDLPSAPGQYPTSHLPTSHHPTSHHPMTQNPMRWDAGSLERMRPPERPAPLPGRRPLANEGFYP